MRFASCFLVLLFATPTLAEDPAEKWEATIQKFEEADQQSAPATDGILFVGSSSIRMWKTDKWFPDDGVLNRGFGGSQISDVNYFTDRIVLKYAPKVIAFYAGDNDVNKGKSAEQVFTDFKAFLSLVEERLPGTHVLYLPIKPSLARWELWPTMDEANTLIQRHLETRFHWHYVDTVTPMLGANGEPRPELFLDDGLHMNEQGYEIWTGLVQPLLANALQTPAQIATGTVFHDQNGNGRFDSDETPIPNVRVSNGREIVRTCPQGQYRLPVADDTALFVIKPAGWRTPINADGLPQFYYLHKPAGSPDSKYPGVPPTGPLPETVDFPLTNQPEPDKFHAILFGDTQARDLTEVGYIAHDVVEELIGSEASFGVTLGDIVFDDLSVFEPLAKSIAVIGIPWFNVIGNHDLNTDAAHDRHSDETFERVFGPSYYSFDYGTVHFVVVDNVEWVVKEESGKGTFRGGLGAEQLTFLHNDLAMLPEDQLVVLMMHIPLTEVKECQSLYRMIERRPFCLSISAHKHYHEHQFLTAEDGWRGAKPHHHLINVTACGSWWSGVPDERGIPHTTMADGAPNGYSIITFDGHEYAVDFKAASRPADYQMNIQTPDEVAVGQLAETDVYVNVFNGSERSTVELQFGSGKQWLPMERIVTADPAYKAVVAAEAAIAEKPWRKLTSPKPSTHLWRASLPADVEPGVYTLRIRTTDMHGRQYMGNRVIRVTGDQE